MMEFLDMALDYLKDHKILAASLGLLFLILLIRNFWFLVKLLVVLTLAALGFVLVLSFVGRATKGKKDLLEPSDSLLMERHRAVMAESYHQESYDRLTAMVSKSQGKIS